MARASSSRSFLRTEPEHDSPVVEFAPAPVPPTPPGVPIPYPNTDPPNEGEEEAQQASDPEFGRGARDEEDKSSNSGLILEESVTTESALDKYHDPVGHVLDETPEPDGQRQSLFEQDLVAEPDIDQRASDLDFDVD